MSNFDDLPPLLYTGKLPNGLESLGVTALIPSAVTESRKLPAYSHADFIVIQSMNQDFALEFNDVPVHVGEGKCVLFVAGFYYCAIKYISTQMLIYERFNFVDKSRKERLLKLFDCMNIPIGETAIGMSIGGKFWHGSKLWQARFSVYANSSTAINLQLQAYLKDFEQEGVVISLDACKNNHKDFRYIDQNGRSVYILI